VHVPTGRLAAAHELLKQLRRPALHAKTLGFVHPATGQRLRFDSALPQDFAEALDTLRSLNLTPLRT
jgi:hypothetical protein